MRKNNKQGFQGASHRYSENNVISQLMLSEFFFLKETQILFCLNGWSFRNNKC